MNLRRYPLLLAMAFFLAAISPVFAAPPPYCNDPQYANSIICKDPQQEKSVIQKSLDDLKSTGEYWVQHAQLSGQVAKDSVFSIISTDNRCTDPWQNSFAAGALTNVITLIVLVSIALGMAWMLGQFLQSPKILASVKDEFFELGMMAVQVLSIFLLIQGTNLWYSLRVDQALLAQSGDPMAQNIYNPANNAGIIDVAMAYSRLMAYKITSELSALSIFNAVLHTLYSSTLWFGVTWRAMWSFNLGPELKPLIDILGSTMQFLGVALGEWIFHVVTLCLIKKWTWGIFMPLSMTLYIIPHTRSAGQALMALILSLSLIYPLMFVMNYEVYRLTSGTVLSGTDLLNNFVDNSGLLNAGIVAVAAVFMSAGVLMPFFAEAAVQTVFELIRTSIYYIVVISLLLPFLNIFITLTSAREVARIFGTNVNFLAFLQLI